MKQNRIRRVLALTAPVLLAAGVFATAPIKSGHWDDFDTLYPSSLSDDNVINGTFNSCQLCHEDVNGGDGWNNYGWKMREFENSGSSTLEAIALMEAFDSDGDGTTNLFEIGSDTQPGWTPGNNNTIYYKNGSTLDSQAPPSGILGSMDPPCGVATNYCSAGVSSSGCAATLSTSGTPSATASTGFLLMASNVEGNKDGVFFQGTLGRQANPWGNGTSFQCVIPPVQRLGLQVGNGTNGACDGTKSQDLNAVWNSSPAKNPGAGAVVQAQLWYRDPFNTSNQTTSLSDAIEFTVCP